MEQKSLLTLMLVVFVAAGGIWYVRNKSVKTDTLCPKETAQLRNSLRLLWLDNMVLTHAFIIRALANSPDKEVVTKRWQQNQDDLGNVMRIYYGDPAGNDLVKLLRDHISIAVDIVQDARVKNQQKLNNDKARWQTNADAIAGFLSKLNPNWSEKDLQNMLYKHLELVEELLVALLKKDKGGDIEFYANIEDGFFDKSRDQSYMLADVLTDGIVKQFPDKFECLCPK